MEMTVFGIKRKTGTYEGKEYDNYYLHCVYSDEGMIEGSATCVIKVRADRYNEQVHCGDKIVCFYDQFGNVIEMRKIK